jgi:hypothetical protein
MTTQHYGAFAFDVPSTWTDRTVRVFVAPEVPGVHTPNIVVTREIKHAGIAFEQHVFRRFAEHAELPGYTSLAQRPETVAGLRAFRTHFRWQRGDLTVDTLVVYIDPGAGPDVMTLTSTSIGAPVDGWLASVAKVLASFAYARPDRAAAPGPIPPPPPPRVPAPAFSVPAFVPMPGVHARR